MSLLEKRYISTRVTGTSLVGVGKQRPVSWGNYCWVADLDDFNRDNWGIRMLNMWAENITDAETKFNLGGKMMALVGERPEGRGMFAVCVDERITDERYFYNKLCFTGFGWPTAEQAREIYDVIGDPTNEYEQFVDPVSYYAKRGGKYDPKTGIITYTFSDNTQ